MHRLLQRLSRDHVNLVRILDLLSLQLDHFCAGRESNFDLKCELLEYIETYADQGHHPLEDLIYDTAAQRHEERHELFERLHSQHQGLTQLTRRFRQSLQNILQGGVMTREELETEGREFVALQRQHLNLEEQEAFPLLEQILTEDDWKYIAANMPQHEDPVFDRPDQVLFHNLFEYLEQAEAGEE